MHELKMAQILKTLTNVKNLNDFFATVGGFLLPKVNSVCDQIVYFILNLFICCRELARIILLSSSVQ